MHQFNNSLAHNYLAALFLIVVYTAGVADTYAGEQAKAARTSEKYGLIELYQSALKNDMRYQASLAHFEATAMEPEISRSRLLPNISFQARRAKTIDETVRGSIFTSEDRGNSNESTYDYQTRNMTLSLEQSIFNKQHYVDLAQSRSIARRAHLELQIARHDLLQRVVAAYFLALDSQTQLDFTRAKKEAVARQREQARARFDVGLVAITDVKEAEASYDMTVADEISDKAELLINLSKLQIIVNKVVSTLKLLSEDVPVVHPKPSKLSAWIRTATSKNPQLLAQKLSTHIAAGEVKRHRADHFPTLNAYLRRNESEIMGDAPSERTTRGIELGLELRVPLFSGGETHYKVKQAAQLALESRNRLEETHRTIRQQTQESYLNVIASMSRTKALARAVESAQSAYESNEIGFGVGTRSSVDVLLALEDLYAAKRDHIHARHRYIIDMIKLKKIAGTLSEKDLQQIDKWLF